MTKFKLTLEHLQDRLPRLLKRDYKHKSYPSSLINYQRFTAFQVELSCKWVRSDREDPIGRSISEQLIKPDQTIKTFFNFGLLKDQKCELECRKKSLQMAQYSRAFRTSFRQALALNTSCGDLLLLCLQQKLNRLQKMKTTPQCIILCARLWQSDKESDYS